ncbi:MAG: PIN domain-containing protein [Candidatus Gottesmanbacteria bacterium]|nr:PIN domain-containing protein [Candidatus Gottesmanbacteria bacterium]
MKRFLLDTNGLLRYSLKDIPVQSEQIAQVFRLVKNGKVELTIPLIVFFEATYTLTKFYGYTRVAVKEKYETLLLAPYIDIPDRYILREAYATWAQHPGVSFADAVLLHTAKLGGKELLTFDRKLKRLAEKTEKDGD